MHWFVVHFEALLSLSLSLSLSPAKVERLPCLRKATLHVWFLPSRTAQVCTFVANWTVELPASTIHTLSHSRAQSSKQFCTK